MANLPSFTVTRRQQSPVVESPKDISRNVGWKRWWCIWGEDLGKDEFEDYREHIKIDLFGVWARNPETDRREWHIPECLFVDSDELTSAINDLYYVLDTISNRYKLSNPIEHTQNIPSVWGEGVTAHTIYIRRGIVIADLTFYPNLCEERDDSFLGHCCREATQSPNHKYCNLHNKTQYCKAELKKKKGKTCSNQRFANSEYCKHHISLDPREGIDEGTANIMNTMVMMTGV